MKKYILIISVILTIFSCNQILALDLRSADKDNIRFIKNSYISIFGREPATAEYDKWLNYFNHKGEKSKMLRLLRNTNEYLGKFTPPGIVNRLSIKVYSKPVLRASKIGVLMPGDSFKVIGRNGKYYKVSFSKNYFTVKGYVYLDDIEILHSTQKINNMGLKKNEDINARIDKLYSDLTNARTELFNNLNMDGKQFLYQYKPGRSIKGEKSRIAYEKLLNDFIIDMKVKLNEVDLDFRGVMIDLRDTDLTKYGILSRLDRYQRMGVNHLVINYFKKGITPQRMSFYRVPLKFPFKQIMERYKDETEKRSMKMSVYISGLDFGKNYAREYGENLSFNGLGFTTDHYYKNNYFVDPAIEEVRTELLKIIELSINNKYFSGIFMSDFFYPPTPELKNDIRSLFAFNKKSIRIFEKDTGLSMSLLNNVQEKILLGWLKNNQVEFYSSIRKLIERSKYNFGMILPEYILFKEFEKIATYKDFPSDFYVISADDLKKSRISIMGKIIVFYNTTDSRINIKKIEEEVIELKKTYPRIIGWLIDKSVEKR